MDPVPSGFFEYHWRDRESFSLGDGFKAGARAAVPGAIVGGVAGFGMAACFNVAAFLMAETATIPFGMSDFINLGIGGLLGAGAGAAATAYQGVTSAAASFQPSHTVRGLVMNEQFANRKELPKFFIDGKLQEEVDLRSYADLPRAPVDKAADPWWKSAALR